MQRNQLDELDQKVLDILKGTDQQVICVINKIDQLTDKQKLLPLIERLSSQYVFRAIVPISALKKNGIDDLLNTIIDLLPENPHLFPEDYVFTEDDAAFVVSLPHYEGSAQDLTSIVHNAKAAGVITICYADPSMLGILKSPGSMGFDIVVAEGQSMGSPLSFGGPTVGWFATRKELARLVPGRIIGESRDSNNTKTYVMTLRAREQDIRREKASSNICTNQTLNAVGSTIHLSWLGPEGLYEIGYQAIQKASYMKQLLTDNNFNVLNHSSSLREFLVETKKSAEKVILEMGTKGFLAGIEYDDNQILVAVTEKRNIKLKRLFLK